jgi:spore coat protein A, manganese oxidase
MKSRIPQPKVELESLRWKTKLAVAPVVRLTDETTTKIYIAQQSHHVFFHDDTSLDPQIAIPDISGQIWGYGTDLNNISSPGPTLEAIADESIQIEWSNELPTKSHHPFVEPPRELRSPGMMSRYDVGHTVVHLHGAHVSWTSDGYPMRVSSGMGLNPLHKKTVLRPGQSEVFEYPNSQPGGATLWYHDHTMDLTSMNVYAGLAGAYLLRHPRENELPSLPKGEYEIPLIIQDRSFVQPNTRIEDDRDNLALLYGDANFLQSYLANGKSPDSNSTRTYRQDFLVGNDATQPSPEFKGQVICVNGKIWPYLEVEPRPYRFRLVNGSNSRMYVLRVSNAAIDPTQPDINAATATLPIYQIGSDGGLFDRYVKLDGTGIASIQPDGSPSLTANSSNFLVLTPGERADVLIDFTGQSEKSFYLTNHAEDGNDSPLGNGGDGPHLGTTDGLLKLVVKPAVTVVGTPAAIDLDRLHADLAQIAVKPDLADRIPMPLQPTRQYVVKEFPRIPLTDEEADKVNQVLADGTQIKPKGWNAITFQQDLTQRLQPGLLWGGEPPFMPNNSPPLVGSVPNGGPQPDRIGLPHQVGDKIELWEFYNISADSHPLHLHHSSMQLHSRVDIDETEPFPVSRGNFGDGVDANERGWKDTIRVNTKQLTRILVRFNRGSDMTRPAEYYTGHYVWHCHILEHEDMGMMRPLEIESPQTTPV